MTLRIETKFDLPNSWLKENIEHPSFSQSYEWEEILSREGKAIERLAIMDGDEPVAMALVQYHELPFGWRYAFCPKGPELSKKLKDASEKKMVYSAILNYLETKKCIFFRVEPEDAPASSIKVFDFNPRATLILDLNKTPDELLGQMHQKTRYNINLAQKKNLRVTDDKNADLFMDLMKRTAKRDKFRLHEERHYHEIIFSPLSQQLTVYFESKPIATAVFAGFGDTFTYVFGASDYEYRSLMAPYLIQWEGIKLGQRYGYKFYDFFGVAPKLWCHSEEVKQPKNPAMPGTKILPRQLAGQDDIDFIFDSKHQYAGVTRFKQGFGGEYFETPGTFDLLISPWKYKLYQFLRAIRRIF